MKRVHAVPFEEWEEIDGPVLWCRRGSDEFYVGQPSDREFVSAARSYWTHWVPLPWISFEQPRPRSANESPVVAFLYSCLKRLKAEERTVVQLLERAIAAGVRE